MIEQKDEAQKLEQSFKDYQAQAAQLKKEGDQLVKELEEALSRVQAYHVLNKVGQKYQGNN